MVIPKIFAASVVSAVTASEEAVSLLQTQVRVHTQSLPDPKKQSAMTGPKWNVDIQTTEQDFACKGGKGKWVWSKGFCQWPPGHPAVSQDLSLKTLDIGGVKCYEDARFNDILGPGKNKCFTMPQVLKDGAWTPKTETEWGPVKNEKDCFQRALADAKCNHWMEDQKYGYPPETVVHKLGVFYAPKGFETRGQYDTTWGAANGTCYCGKMDGSTQWKGTEPSDFEIAAPGSDVGVWMCQLHPEDMVKFTVDMEENFDREAVLATGPAGSDKGGKEPKEKKSKEDKQKCKDAKKAARDAKAALKDLRKQLKDMRKAIKDLKAQIKAAKAALAEKRGAKKGAC